MRNLSFLIAMLVAVGCASAQSLKPESPFPMKTGINQGTSDSLVGTQYWYYYVTPGFNTLKVRFKNPTTLYGATLNTTLTITVSDDKHTWKVVKQVNANKNQSEATFESNKVDKRIKIIVAVAPPNQNLLRMGGDYELEASGNVQFGESAGSADPIIRTFQSMVNSYGATRFLADGSVIGSDGTRGAWTSFDPENRLYTVQMGKFRWSVQYLPGYGLVDPADPRNIQFQELRR